jgi:hypothetical protein
MIFEFFKKKESEQTNWDIDLTKGLFIGVGVEIIGQGINEVKPIYIEWGDLAGHLCVYGTTRVGKTRLMVALIRQCILRGMDILVVEPKGSVGQETIAWVLQFAQEADRLRDFRYCSPMFPELSVNFNPLYGLSNEEVASLVATIVPADDEFFKSIGYTITIAIMAGLEFLEMAEGKDEVSKIIEQEYKRTFSGNANIIDKFEHISDPDLATRVILPKPNETLADMDPPYRSIVTFADLATYSTLEGIEAILSHVEKITEEQYNVKTPAEKNRLNIKKTEAYRALKEQAEKDKGFFSKVASSFQVILQKMSTGKLGEILCSTKINPIMDGYKNPNHGQILIIQPYPLIYKDASDAFVRIFFAMFTAAYGNIGASGRTLPRELCLFIDEGGSVLYPGVEALFNKAGGIGLRIFIFTQSFADYEDTLGPEVSKIVNDNTNTKLYLKMNDASSRKQLEESFGMVRVATSGYMGSKLDMRISMREEEKPLLLSSHIAEMKKQEFLLQYKEGNFICCAPAQHDPDYWIEMPKVAAEELFDNHAKWNMLSIDRGEELIKAEEINLGGKK